MGYTLKTILYLSVFISYFISLVIFLSKLQVKDASDVLIDEFENLKRELAGDMFNDWAKKF